jgi:hypothetical protein
VALNLLGDHLQHVNLLQVRIALHHAREDVVQPAGALAARRALATALNLRSTVGSRIQQQQDCQHM